jgi:Tol biopolymer transport system component/DNA-binding winged helix-turn-helix (wHTH) protein
VAIEGSRQGRVRFGAFEVDMRTAEVRKHGLRVRLQEQPFQILAALLERPGEIVTRDELIRRLWADGTVVDYEGGLNAAVTRLRQALSDSAETPRYLETIARRGYRWIAPVERPDEASAPRVDADAVLPVMPGPAPRRFSLLIVAVVAVAIVALVALTWSAFGARERTEHAVRMVPLTTGVGSERNASFSPDGTQIVYEWEGEDHRRHIYIKEVAAGDPVPVTTGTSAEYGPEWSPDGRLVAFLRASGPADLDLCVVPPLAGVERKLATLAAPRGLILERFVRRMTWTADSSHIIVSVPDRRGGGEGLLLISIVDGAKRWLTDPKPDEITGDREPAMSPGGREIAFARGEVGASETIFLLPLTADLAPAGAARPLPGAGRSRSPAFSPDGTELLYTGVSPGLTTSGLSKVRIAGGSPASILFAGVTAATPTVSRTGRVAFSRVRVESSLWRQEIPSKLGAGAAPPPVRVTKAVAADGNADYSPDGRRLAFGSNRSGARDIWTCDSEGGRCQAITSFGASYATGAPRWSPDGRQIAFDSGTAGRMHIYVLDANGGSPRRLTDDRTGGVVPAWSRDGTWIYFSSSRSGTNEIWKIPTAGGAPIRVTRSGGFCVMEALDGSALFYTKTAEHADLFRAEIDGSGERVLLRGVAKRGFFVTNDRIYYLHQDADASVSLRVFMLQTGQDIRIAHISEPLFPGLGLSPDGRYLIYTQLRIASNLMLAEGVLH